MYLTLCKSHHENDVNDDKSKQVIGSHPVNHSNERSSGFKASKK